MALNELAVECKAAPALWVQVASASMFRVPHSDSAPWFPPMDLMLLLGPCQRPCTHKTCCNAGEALAKESLSHFCKRVNCFLGFRPWIAVDIGMASVLLPAARRIELRMALPPSAPAMAPRCTVFTTWSAISALDSGGPASPLATSLSGKVITFCRFVARSLNKNSRPRCSFRPFFSQIGQCVPRLHPYPPLQRER